MLSSLYIENIAVIEKTTIGFTEGFNVLTGETGAGKSIVIDAINAVLGQRTSKDIIRTGAKSALVCAEFSGIDDLTAAKMQEYGFVLDEDGTLILQREISFSGKTSCRINARPATAGVLREIASSLIDIHGQHESYELMSPEKHQNYIDDFGCLHDDIAEYKEVFVRLRQCKRRLETAKTDDAQREHKIDLLRYQADEIDAAQLAQGELEELTEQKNIVINKEKITSAVSSAYSLLGGDGEYSALKQLEDAADSLSTAENYMPELQSLSSRVRDAFYEIQDCSSELADLLEDADDRQYDQEQIEERLDLIYRLSRKYGGTIEEITAFSENARAELAELLQYDANMEKLSEEFGALFEQAKCLALNLSEKRHKTAAVFAKKVQEEMTYLDMPNVRLVVDFKTAPLTETGMDKTELLISANPGEEPKPVSKIASGGELSRMMLAIKNVLAGKDSTQTLIFDEVDTGISGSASQKVGYKLKSVSNGKQVICVTHQAQIAALGDTHFLIKKHIEENRTFTQVKKLAQDERVYELARIIGGVEITPLTFKHAQEMLQKR